MVLLLFILALLHLGNNLHPVQGLIEKEVALTVNENCSRYLWSNTLKLSDKKQLGNVLGESRYDIEGTRMCPPWQDPNNNCTFGNPLKALVSFSWPTKQTWLQTSYCMTTSHERTSKRNDVIGSCLWSAYGLVSLSYTYYPLPCNISTLNEYMCAGLNREGQLCGRCVSGYAPPVISYSVICVNCTDYHYNWIKYIVLGYGPLTIFCLLICVFHISLMSRYLFGFVFYCQIVTMPIIIREIVLNNKYRGTQTLNVVETIYIGLFGIWNLDWFRTLYDPFCLHPNMTVVQALALDYLIAVYPLLLLIIAFVLVSLHSRNFKIVVVFWKPFKSILRPFFRNLNIQTSLIESFASLYFLSAMKVQSVTLDLISPTPLYYVDGQVSKKFYLYFAGDVEYFGEEHWPYGVLALCFFAVFLVFPALLLFLYPSRLFQQFLNKIHCNFVTVKIFMDVFQGNYKDGTENTRDYRAFAGVFFLTRFIIVANFIVNSSLFSSITLSAILIVLLFSLAILHPQRTRIHYILDCIIITMLLMLTVSAIGLVLSPKSSITWITSQLLASMSSLLPFIYITSIACFWIVRVQKIPQRFGRCVTNKLTEMIRIPSNERQMLLVNK